MPGDQTTEEDPYAINEFAKLKKEPQNLLKESNSVIGKTLTQEDVEERKVNSAA